MFSSNGLKKTPQNPSPKKRLSPAKGGLRNRSPSAPHLKRLIVAASAKTKQGVQPGAIKSPIVFTNKLPVQTDSTPNHNNQVANNTKVEFSSSGLSNREKKTCICNSS